MSRRVTLTPPPLSMRMSSRAVGMAGPHRCHGFADRRIPQMLQLLRRRNARPSNHDSSKRRGLSLMHRQSHGQLPSTLRRF